MIIRTGVLYGRIISLKREKYETRNIFKEIL